MGSGDRMDIRRDKMKYYVVDAFTTEQFKGNPAGVCVVNEFPPAELMQKIAAENRLSETAFVCQRSDGDYDLRWFTPGAEVNLCGHATLGTSYVLAHFVEPERKEFRFHSLSGSLTARCAGKDRYELNFPAWKPEPVEVTEAMRRALGFEPERAWLSRDLIFLVDSYDRVRDFQPDYKAIEAVPEGMGIFLTARGYDSDFVCRTFFPKIAVDEDPVCGSAHSELVPLWAEMLDKNELVSHQLSPRTGILYCENRGDRVKISGDVTLYQAGELNINLV